MSAIEAKADPGQVLGNSQARSTGPASLLEGLRRDHFALLRWLCRPHRRGVAPAAHQVANPSDGRPFARLRCPTARDKPLGGLHRPMVAHRQVNARRWSMSNRAVVDAIERFVFAGVALTTRA